MRGTKWFARLGILSAMTIGILFISGSLALAKRDEPETLQAIAEIIRVPQDVANLQDAINQIGDDGVIEITGGTYAAPIGGFRINNPRKSLTIQAANSEQVILDGQGVHDILRMQNSSRADTGLIQFRNIVFANGFSTQDSIAAAITIQYAYAKFEDCEFRDNTSQMKTVGGAIHIWDDSEITFINGTWLRNTSQIGGGGIGIRDNSTVDIHNSLFDSNSVGVANHERSASGGAINVAESTLRVYNTEFRNNVAGAFAGALYSIGRWDQRVTDVEVRDSVFQANYTARHPSVIDTQKLEGGAINAEDNTTFKLYDSQLIENHSMIGGGLNIYRAQVEVYRSIFLGNRATDTLPQSGFGGAISAASQDGADDGINNRPPISLTVKNSVFQGRYGGTGFAAQKGGCLFAGGDGSRLDGDPGVPDMGSVAENRAPVIIEDSIFYDCDASATDPDSGDGGAIYLALVALTMKGNYILNSDATGQWGSGGGMAIIQQSDATINNVIFAGNSTSKLGGALFIQGSNVNMSECVMTHNRAGTSDVPSSYGAAIFTGVDEGRGLNTTGNIQNCLFSDNYGISIFDDDRRDGPFNDIRYNENKFYSTTFRNQIYSNSIGGLGLTVEQLNSLVVKRNAADTDKSQVDNIWLDTMPTIAKLFTNKTGPISGPTDPYYLTIVWSGRKAALDDANLADGAELKLCTTASCPTSILGRHVLSVDNSDAVLELNISLPGLFLPFVTRK